MKRFVSLCLAAMLLMGCASAAGEEAVEDVFDEAEWESVETLKTVEDLAVNVPSAILMEKTTGQVIFAHNADERLAPASVTKIMTMLLVVEAIDAGELKLDDMVTASTKASQMGGSQIYLKEGEQMTVHEMLKSVAVASANDAAVALAEHIAGSEESFVARMNARALELGMESTHFSNCTGLPTEGEHLTTAHDIACMSRELLSHDMIKEYTTIWMDSVRDGAFGLSNTNKLIRYYNGATGLKTGFTAEAKYCVSATAERDGVEYIAVVMKGETSDIRFEAAKVMLNYAFANYTLVSATPAEVLAPIPVTLGEVEYVQPILAGEQKILVEKTGVTGLQKTVELVDSLQAPVAEGQKLGTLRITDAEGTQLAEVDIVACEAVDKLSVGQIFVKYLRLLFVGDL